MRDCCSHTEKTNVLAVRVPSSVISRTSTAAQMASYQRCLEPLTCQEPIKDEVLRPNAVLMTGCTQIMGHKVLVRDWIGVCVSVCLLAMMTSDLSRVYSAFTQSVKMDSSSPWPWIRKKWDKIWMDRCMDGYDFSLCVFFWCCQMAVWWDYCETIFCCSPLFFYQKL